MFMVSLPESSCVMTCYIIIQLMVNSIFSASKTKNSFSSTKPSSPSKQKVIKKVSLFHLIT